MAMSDSQRYPWNPYQINIMEDIVVFLGLEMFNSENSNLFSCSLEMRKSVFWEPAIEKNKLKKI